MNIAVKFLCLLLLLGMAGLFYIKNPDGEAWLSAEDLVPEVSMNDLWPRDLLSKLKGLIRFDASNTEESVPVYRWKNKEGIWVYSDTAPIELEAELIRVSTGANADLYPGLINNEPAVTRPSSKNGDAEASPLEGDTANLIKNSKNVERLLQERKRQMDETLSRQ